MKAIFTAISLLCAAASAAPFEPLFDSAKRAMQDGLWDVAAIRLREASAAPDAAPEILPSVQRLLGECLVRSGRPDDALDVLGQSAVRDLPEAAFWAGQALAGKGRFAEAVGMLLKVATDPANPLRPEASFTAANLQLSLGLPDAALATLSLLRDSPDRGANAEALLRRIAILIDQGRPGEAREIFPGADDIPEDQIRFASLLQGYLSLSQGEPAAAQQVFASLLGDPTGQGIGRYNLAAIGMADAIAAQGNTLAAVESLFSFIQSRPETARLAPMFQRINSWLPEDILTTDHPALVRLAGWLPKTIPPAAGLINIETGTAEAAYPSAAARLTDLEVFSMYARAMGLRRVDTPVAKAESQLLLHRIQLFAPDHFLAARSLLALAKWKTEDGRSDAAMAIHDALLASASPPRTKGEAAFSSAREAYRNGDAKRAAELFAQAAELLDGNDREAAAFNIALAGLALDDSAPLTVQNLDPEAKKRLAADLALERALSEDSAEKAKVALDGFLRENPGHPRAAEARLAIAEAALASAPPDLSLAQAQLDTLLESAADPPGPKDPRLELVKLRLLDISESGEETIALATRIAEDFPGSPAASEASLILGKCLFKNGRYNEARLTLEKLATSEPGTQRSQAALLLAARSAALGATAQSREEALSLFDRTMAVDGPLKSLALLEKARLLIDLNRLPAAIESLRSAYSATTPDDPSRLPTGLLLAEAIYGLGDSDPESLSEALGIYDSLVDLTKGNLATHFRLQYLRGLTLEKLPDPADPTKTRLAEARDAYFSVLDRPTDPPPPEWEWFERSGFRLLTILENQRNWKAAISIAEKLSSFGGPRAEEAATRARQLRLKHLVWDD
ncbi:tetratricopeptide repeat protein [Akkermansiaceae bacterium]|nr:tetratricopeptide repeat protein [Akkermansiaceae bacterium]